MMLKTHDFLEGLLLRMYMLPRVVGLGGGLVLITAAVALAQTTTGIPSQDFTPSQAMSNPLVTFFLNFIIVPLGLPGLAILSIVLFVLGMYGFLRHGINVALGKASFRGGDLISFIELAASIVIGVMIFDGSLFHLLTNAGNAVHPSSGASGS